MTFVDYPPYLLARERHPMSHDKTETERVLQELKKIALVQMQSDQQIVDLLKGIKGELQHIRERV